MARDRNTLELWNRGHMLQTIPTYAEGISGPALESAKRLARRLIQEQDRASYGWVLILRSGVSDRTIAQHRLDESLT